MRRIPTFALAAGLVLAVSQPVRADSFDAAEKAMDSIASRMFSEQNIGLLFGLLRQSLAATAEGRPASDLPPEALARIEASSKEMQREIAAAAMHLLHGIEKDLRDTGRP